MFAPTLSAQDQRVLSSWRLGPILSTEIPPTGTVNRTVLLQTANGAYAFRAYHRPDLSRVLGEHTALRHAAAQGIPVCPPVPLPNGETVVEQGGSLFALFSGASGQQIGRHSLSFQEVAAAGRCLARIHRAFEAFPIEQARRKQFTFDTPDTLARLTHLEEVIPAHEEQTEIEMAALRQLAERREWIVRTEAQDAAMQVRFAAMPSQIVHGDFQETNLFFDQGEVSAVIDWDQFGAAPRVWDILRSLDLMLGLAPKPCRVFLNAYRSLSSLPEEELEEGAAWCGFLADRNLWVYEAFFLNGNERVRPFLRQESFQPFEVRFGRIKEEEPKRLQEW